MKTLSKPDFEQPLDGLILPPVITWRLSPPLGGEYFHEVTAGSMGGSDPRPVVGPQQRDEQYVFDEYDSTARPGIEYSLTIRETGQTRLVESNGAQFQ